MDAPYCEHTELDRKPYLKACCWSCIAEAIDAALLAAVAEEREACAKVADEPYKNTDVDVDEAPGAVGKLIAAAIRSRSTTPAGEEGK